jgi:hypothetical protein
VRGFLRELAPPTHDAFALAYALVNRIRIRGKDPVIDHVFTWFCNAGHALWGFRPEGSKSRTAMGVLLHKPRVHILKEMLQHPDPASVAFVISAARSHLVQMVGSDHYRPVDLFDPGRSCLGSLRFVQGMREQLMITPTSDLVNALWCVDTLWRSRRAIEMCCYVDPSHYPHIIATLDHQTSVLAQQSSGTTFKQMYEESDGHPHRDLMMKAVVEAHVAKLQIDGEGLFCCMDDMVHAATDHNMAQLGCLHMLWAGLTGSSISAHLHALRSLKIQVPAENWALWLSQSSVQLHSLNVAMVYEYGYLGNAVNGMVPALIFKLTSSNLFEQMSSAHIYTSINKVVAALSGAPAALRLSPAINEAIRDAVRQLFRTLSKTKPTNAVEGARIVASYVVALLALWFGIVAPADIEPWLTAYPSLLARLLRNWHGSPGSYGARLLQRRVYGMDTDALAAMHRLTLLSTPELTAHINRMRRWRSISGASRGPMIDLKRHVPRAARLFMVRGMWAMLLALHRWNSLAESKEQQDGGRLCSVPVEVVTMLINYYIRAFDVEACATMQRVLRDQ